MQDRAVYLVVRVDAGLGDEVARPEDVGVGRPRLDRRIAARGHVLRLVGVRAAVAVGHAPHVEAQHLAAVAEHVGAVPLDRRLRRDADLRPVEVGVVLVLRELGDDQLPEQVTVPLVEAHQDAAVALVLGVARPLVVRADQHAPAGDDRAGVALGAEVRDPLHVLARGRVEAGGQPALGGDHVARLALPPLRLVGGGTGVRKEQACGQERERSQKDGRRSHRRNSSEASRLTTYAGRFSLSRYSGRGLG